MGKLSPIWVISGISNQKSGLSKWTTPINKIKAQRVLAAEKFRQYYDKQARENMKEYGSLGGKKYSPKEGVIQMDEPFLKDKKIDVQKTLARKAGVGTGTYSRCKTVLDSNNEELKQQMLSGEITINAAYNMVSNSELEKFF